MDKVRSIVSSIISYVVVTLYALLSLYPFLWMISSALKSNQEVLTSHSLIPSEIHFDIIINTWNHGHRYHAKAHAASGTGKFYRQSSDPGQ